MKYLLTPLQVADLYDVSLRQVYYALDQRIIKGKRWGRNWVVDIRDLPDSWPTQA